jgi:hypothetical protein
MTNEELDELAVLAWMPSRIPVVDALAALVPKGAEERIASSYEQRWYPQDDGSLRLLLPYHGGPFDSAFFTSRPARGITRPVISA